MKNKTKKPPVQNYIFVGQRFRKWRTIQNLCGSRDFIKLPTIYAANHENQMLQFSQIKMKISTLFMVSDRTKKKKNPGGPTTDKAKRCYQ